MTLDINQLMTDIKTTANTLLNQDLTTLRGFSDRQLKALALQAKLVADNIAAGDIDADLRDFFLDSLEDMALNFVKTLRGLVMVTIEKLWNAIVGVIWGAINAAVPGLGLIVPSN